MIFFMLFHPELFSAVKQCIEESGEADFVARAEMSVSILMSVFEIYLNSTLFSFNGGIYLQKKGICIGSSVAPISVHLFISY